MDARGFSGFLMRSAHRELQILALALLGAALLCGGGALVLGVLQT